ncbi:MAG: hypothetical protein M3083_16515 [Actinomycetota bacterium]|nr:hypothetical protein [Actinomycetota bacterium]MDQ6946442.1 hypothetical protein [Actinomycetota bacterium]
MATIVLSGSTTAPRRDWTSPWSKAGDGNFVVGRRSQRQHLDLPIPDGRRVAAIAPLSV